MEKVEYNSPNYRMLPLQDDIMRKVFDKAFVIYCIIGILNFIVCTSIMFLLYNLGVCNENMSALVNYALGGVIWYFGCLKLVFPGQKQSVGLVVRFVLEIMLCYVVSYLLLAPLVFRALSEIDGFRTAITFLTHMPEEQFAGNCNMAIGALLYAILNYFGQRYFVFHPFHRHKKKSEQTDLERTH